jgi:GxxExxY protein
MSKIQVVRTDLIYPELSYIIVGCAFDVFNQLGPGHSEKVYQRAFAQSLTLKGLKFKEQLYYKVMFNSANVGKAFCDFEVEGKIIVELKKDERFSKTHIDQILDYIKKSNLLLSIIFNFTPEGVKYKRLINVSESGLP